MCVPLNVGCFIGSNVSELSENAAGATIIGAISAATNICVYSSKVTGEQAAHYDTLCDS